MWKQILVLGLTVAVLTGLPLPLRSEDGSLKTKQWTFDSKDVLAGWTMTGDVAFDNTKSREGQQGALRIGPGGKALIKLRDKAESGKFELWVYDDGTTPENAKAPRVGPRWGLLESNAKMLVAGILYNSYIGGNEGYTATLYDGKTWFNELFWLGVNRRPAGWHKWTFDFDPEAGLQVFHNGKELNSVDPAKVDLKGFTSIVIYGDERGGRAQTIWVSNASVTLGGPVKVVSTGGEADPYDDKAVAADAAASRPVTLYTKDNVPPTPKLDDLPLVPSISQYGMTWTFDKPAHAGRFVNGDWYVVGSVTVKAIDPKPLYGSQIPKFQLDHQDKERPEAQRVRNGFMINPPAKMKVAYDSGVRNFFDASLVQKLPAELKPGDSLVSTISMPKGLKLQAPLWHNIERGVDDSSPVRAAAVLTCLAAPQPADAFRPAFCGGQKQIYLARNLKRELLPTVAAVKGMPTLQRFVRFTQRPWVGTCFFGFEGPVENMPQYGRDYGRVAGISALLLCTDLKPEQKEPLLVHYVQVGIDLGGMIRGGHPGFDAHGGHGSGRKLPIVFAGLLLDDPVLANINKSFPKASFGEDEQTAYGDCWTGAKVVFTGHSAIEEATGVGRSRGNNWGPYEHTPPAQWGPGNNTSESYRRCCTSVAWVAQALALRLMHAEKAWNHDAFLDYVDRWMFENDAGFLKTIKQATGNDHDHEWSRQGQSWEPYVNELWFKYRPTVAAPTDGWKQQHDDSYYRTAIEKMLQTSPAKPRQPARVRSRQATAASTPIRLFTKKGVPDDWVIGRVQELSEAAPPEAKWFVDDEGNLTGTNTYDTWLMSKAEYGDFELKLEIKVSALGNSGVALRTPMHGHPCYEGMELQIADPRYYEGKGLPVQLSGAIYRALPPRKQTFNPDDWNTCQITCLGPRIKVVLNGEVVQDFNLDEQTAKLQKDKGTDLAEPLKDRPRKGRIGFQELCRDGGHTQIRNVTLRDLDK